MYIGFDTVISAIIVEFLTRSQDKLIMRCQSSSLLIDLIDGIQGWAAYQIVKYNWDS